MIDIESHCSSGPFLHGFRRLVNRPIPVFHVLTDFFASAQFRKASPKDSIDGFEDEDPVRHLHTHPAYKAHSGMG